MTFTTKAEIEQAVREGVAPEDVVSTLAKAEEGVWTTGDSGTDGARFDLDALTKLEADAARLLTQWLPRETDGRPLSGVELSLNGLSQLEPEAAGALASWRPFNYYPEGENGREAYDHMRDFIGICSKLSLNGITSLDVETARALFRRDGKRIGDLYDNADGDYFWRRLDHIELDGMAELSPEVAAEIAAWDRGMVLRLGLTSLGADVAAALARWEGSCLCLNKLTSLEVADLEPLTEWHGEWSPDMQSGMLQLDGLPALSADLASLLGEIGREVMEIHLNGVQSLDGQTAAVLGEWGDDGCIIDVWLDGLKAIEPEALRAVVGRNRVVSLCGVTHMDDALAESLVQGVETFLAGPCEFPSMVYLGVESLSESVARKLAAIDVDSLYLPSDAEDAVAAHRS